MYEDLEGNAQITEFLESTAEVGSSDLAGGWNETESPVVTEEAKEALKKATEGLMSAEYTPVAYLANQVVSGTNYCLLCEVGVTSPYTEAAYTIVYVYEDLEGNAEITDIVDFITENY